MRLLVLALTVPIATVIAELLALFGVAHLIGIGPALLILAATSLTGALLTRYTGARGWRRFRQALQSGRPPGTQATHGLIALTGAVLLAFPGYLTDLAGALLFLPPVRAMLARAAEHAVTRRLRPDLAGQVFGPRTVRVRRTDTTSPTVVEGDIVGVPGDPD